MGYLGPGHTWKGSDEVTVTMKAISMVNGNTSLYC